MGTYFDSIDADQAWDVYTPGPDRPWNRRLAAHLYRRAAFGATRQQLDAAVKQSPSDLVAEMVVAVEPDRYGTESDELSAAMLATGRIENISAWWLHQMRHSPAPLRERMTLFWHGHFATGNDKVNDAHLMFAQHKMLRTHALDRFGPLLHDVSTDPAMLVYLDSTTNRKAHPNENYAREVMELFCLGEGNYSEADVQQLARCLTGWEVKRDKFRFNRYQYDSGTKTIFGQTGLFNGTDGINLVLRNKALAPFIVRKLVRWFVMDEPELPDHIIEPLAVEFRNSDLEIGSLVQRILSSNLFFSDMAIGRRIRSPIDLAVGMLTCLDATTNIEQLARGLDQLGQSLFRPPNVKGWDGGRAWINSSTLLGRANMVRRLIAHDNTRFGRGTLESSLAEQDVVDADSLIDHAEAVLMAVPIPPRVRSGLVASLQPSGSDRSRLFKDLLHAIATLPEYQLG